MYSNTTGNSRVRVGAFGSFKRKKLGGRKWRRELFDYTKWKAHYRSVNALTLAMNTDATLVVANNILVRAIPSDFWLAPVALPIDAGTVVPLFESDIVLRGGIVRLNVGTTLPDSDALRVRVWGIWTSAAAPTVGMSAYVGASVVDWDPTCIPDFHNNGKIVLYREATLTSGDQAMDITYKMRAQKIDKITFSVEGGNTLFWWIQVYKITNTTALQQNVDYTRSHNLSFSADAK